MMKHRLIGFAALCLFSAVARAAEKPATEGAVPGQWTMDFDAARKVAAEKKLPLLLNFTGSDWCVWCKLMDKQVFSQEAWQSFAKTNLMLVWIDFPTDKSLVPAKYVARNQALSEFFGLQGYPSYILLDDDGKTQIAQLASDQEGTPESFIAKIREALQERASAIDAFLKSAPDKTAQEYRAAVQKRIAAREELKSLEAMYDKRSRELNELVEDQTKRMKALRDELLLARLPPAAAEAYRAKKARQAAVKAELKAWFNSPHPNDEPNMQKLRAWKSELATLEKELRDLLPE